MIDYQPFFQHIENTPLKNSKQALLQAIDHRINARTHGDLPEWQKALDELPDIKVDGYRLDQDTVSLVTRQPLDGEQKSRFRQTLMRLHPWRKGPFSLFDLPIDTEWRSDWKWQRIAPHIKPLKNKMVLDVGCGNGYHCWRMRGAGARFVLGIDPSPKFLFQFQVIKHYLPNEPVYLLPLLSEDMPATGCFDSVFSMGVLYHRKSPLTHIEELRDALRPGGELVLETLVVNGDAQTVFMPGKRYASMPNVWFLPSTLALEGWLSRLGFRHIRTVDVNQTSLDEQRSTEWMNFHSLAQFLDPKDKNKTTEGYPAPRRAFIIAEKD